MFGDDLLVAPVLKAGVTTWPVYLPAGEWIDVHTGNRVIGGRVVDADVAERSRTPVYARAEAWAELALAFELSASA